MKISILGPSNLKSFSEIIGVSQEEIKKKAKKIGEVVAKDNCQLVVVFAYDGMLKLVGDSFRKAGGKLEMLYTENDYDWDVKMFSPNLKFADIKTRKNSWHDILLALVRDSDIVVCAGLSAGVMIELGYMRFDHSEKKGDLKTLIGVKELLKEGKFPPEISKVLNDIIVISSVDDLDSNIKRLNIK